MPKEIKVHSLMFNLNKDKLGLVVLNNIPYRACSVCMLNPQATGCSGVACTRSKRKDTNTVNILFIREYSRGQNREA